MKSKTINVHTKAATGGKATAEQLTQINKFALEEMTADDVYVRTAYLAHNGIDRDKEAFDDALLESFTASLPGKGLFVKHPMGYDGDTGPGVGRWFAAKVVSMSLDEARAALDTPNLQFPPSTQTAKLLEASYYMARTPKNAGLIADTDAGIAGDVSIGFRAADRAAIMDGENVIAYRLLPPGEAFEGSLVWLGAQPGARVHKSARRAGASDGDRVRELEVENAQLRKALDASFEKQCKLAELAARHRGAAPESATPAVKTGTGLPSVPDNPALHGKVVPLHAERKSAPPWLSSIENPAVTGIANASENENKGTPALPHPLKNPAVTGVLGKGKNFLDNPAITGIDTAS